jgi:hypothetical protein
MPIASGSQPHGDGRNESRGFDYDFLHGLSARQFALRSA